MTEQAHRTFGEAVNRSMASMPPKTLLTDWAKNTPEGRLVSAAQAMKDDGLVAWLMAAPMTAVSSAAPPEHPDAALLRACRNFRAAWDAERGDNPDEDIDPTLTTVVFERLRAVVDLPATTIEGMRAKAEVGYMMAFERAFMPDCQDWREEVERDAAAAIDVLRDLSGRQAVAAQSETPA